MIKNDPILRNIPLYKPPQASHEALRLVHTNEYIEDLFSLHKTASTGYSELPLNSDIVQSFMYSTGGTILATDLTSSFRFVFNLGGGFHHSFPDHAEGFCYLNDAAIATKHYQQKFPGRKVLFIDLDVHQGNGNTFTFRDDPDVFTFSMHQGNLYPKKEISDLDISLHEGCRDEEYLRLLEDSLRKIKAEFKPDLIYYLAGADPFEGDTLGEIKMSFSGLQARDVLVKQFIEETGARAVILTAGGYAKNFEDTCVIHFNTARIFGENSKPAILVKES
ncbi:MAG: histone deacetylase [Leptospira sp.]|nr:histone deacetylase [Leptospira sp.]